MEANQGFEDLTKEIEMLRALLLSIYQSADTAQDLKAKLRILEVFSLAASRLASILKAHRFLSSDISSFSLIDQALAEVFADLKEEGFSIES